MAIITINTNEYFAYATVAEADIYLLPSLSYATWSELSTDQKGGALIQSARFLDSLSWKPDYSSQALREAEQAIVNASIEIAALFGSGETSWIGGTVPEDATKRLKAGSVEIEYMARPWFAQRSINWPPYIYALLKPYLLGFDSAVGLGATAFGTDAPAGPSAYNGDYRLVNY